MEKKQSLPVRVYKEACFQIDDEVRQFRSSHGIGNGYCNPRFNQTQSSYLVAQRLIKDKNWALLGKATAVGSSNPTFGIDILMNKQPHMPHVKDALASVTDKERELLADLMKKETEDYKKTMEKSDTLRTKVDNLASSTKLRVANAGTMEELDKILADFRAELTAM